MVLQVEYLAQDSDFVVQLMTNCDSVLYAYLSKIADTTEKRHYLDLSCTTVVGGLRGRLNFDIFLDDLHKFEVLDLNLSVFQPYDLRVLLATIGDHFILRDYFKNFRSSPERSKEFHYEGGLWHAFVATRYMRFLRMPSNSR